MGAMAKFSVALTREPPGIVAIPIKSSDPLEGELLSNSISFSQVNWSVPQVVSVIGTNPDVINGEQDYRIVLGPVASTDISYDGLDPEDIEIRGLSLTVRDSQPIVFVANIKQRFRPKYERNGGGEVTYSILSAEPGISIDKYDGTLEWTPPQVSQGGLYEVEIESSLSGRSFTNSVEIRVLPSVEAAGRREGEKVFTVIDDKSSFQGARFEYGIAVPADFKVREVPIEDLAKPSQANILISGFYTLSEEALDLLIPLSIAPKPTELPNVNYLVWSNRTNSWVYNDSTFVDLVVIDKKLYAKLRIYRTNRLGVIVGELGYNR